MRKLMPNWKYANTIADVLGEIRKNMASNANRRLNQPPEGANYWAPPPLGAAAARDSPPPPLYQ